MERRNTKYNINSWQIMEQCEPVRARIALFGNDKDI